MAKKSTADNVAVLAEKIENHTKAVETLCEKLEGHIEKDDTRFRDIERFQWKAVGAIGVLSVLANWLLSKI